MYNRKHQFSLILAAAVAVLFFTASSTAVAQEDSEAANEYQEYYEAPASESYDASYDSTEEIPEYTAEESTTAEEVTYHEETSENSEGNDTSEVAPEIPTEETVVENVFRLVEDMEGGTFTAPIDTSAQPSGGTTASRAASASGESRTLSSSSLGSREDSNDHGEDFPYRIYEYYYLMGGTMS